MNYLIIMFSVKLNYIYNTDKPLITFGNYVKKTTTGALAKYKSLSCKRINLPNKIENKSFRDYEFHYSHLKTFKYKLYKNIDHMDLMKDGEYIRSATDAAIMIPMLEMAGDKIKCVDDVLYKYTSDHEESIHYKKRVKINKGKITNIFKVWKDMIDCKFYNIFFYFILYFVIL